jgi:hypothetical protein
MSCDQIRPLLLDYVMEEMPASERGGIARHLETCSACSEEVGKVRQTLGVMAQGAAFEEVPQRIRIVAEPAGRWLEFWRNPARLAFAAGGLACLAVALLALARTTIRYEHGSFEIAFGVAASSVQSPAAAPLPPAPAPPRDAVAAGGTAPLTHQEVLALIQEAVAASEARQTAGAARLLQTSIGASERRAEASRLSDRRELAESFRYIQAAQLNMWKQQVESQQVVSALLARSGAEGVSQP